MTLSAAERYLQAWHARHPDGTGLFATLHDREGRSSYDMLAARIDAAETVLDVACGAGTLLTRVEARAPRRSLAGLDLNISDLHLAQASLPAGCFVHGRAQALPFSTASIDAVTCHLALMLMDDPGAVLREMRRVLRPGGALHLVVINPFGFDPQLGRIIRALATSSHHGHDTQPPAMGDQRTFSAEGLCSLLSDEFQDIELEEVVVTREIPRSDLWEFLLHSVYGLDHVSAERAEAEIERLALPPTLSWRVPLTFAAAHIPGSH